MTVTLGAIKEKVIQRMTASHLAGPDLVDAVRVYIEATALGWPGTFGYWSGPQDTPETIAQRYTDTANLIGHESLNCYLSIKVTGFNYDYEQLTALLELAAENGIRVHCDAMGPESASPTFDLLERALKVHRNLGCTLPARWQRSLDDTARVVEWGIPVRVVKGQWADPATPGVDAREQYLEIIRRLSGKAAHVAVATHDRRLARRALQALTESKTSCEMEQLSSLPQNCARLAREFHVPLRVYIPFGHPSLPYDIWQVRTRPQIVSWVLRDILTGKHRSLPAVHQP